MICIYDFDGTLTPYSLPQYPIIKQCGYTDLSIINKIEELVNNKGLDMYDAYYKVYIDILNKSGIELSIRNICNGAENVEFNQGVLEYFKKFQTSNTGLKHYIVTSGIKEYVKRTKIAKNVNGIFGVTFYVQDNKFKDIDFLLTDKKKIDVIKTIQSENDEICDIMYFGDGLTDRYAFEYVHNIGGKSIFVIANNQAKSTYEKLNKKRIIDYCFDADFSKNSELDKFMQKQVMIHKNK